MRFGKSRRFKWHPHDTAGYSSCADYSRRCCRSCGTNGAQRPKDSLPKIMDLVAQEQGYGMRRSDLPGSSRRAVSWFRCGQLRPLAAAKAGSLRCRDGCRKWLPQCWSWHIIVWLILIIIIMVWHVEPSPTITDLSICVVASPLQHMLLAVAAFRGVQTYEKIRADRPEPSSVRKENIFPGMWLRHAEEMMWKLHQRISKIINLSPLQPPKAGFASMISTTSWGRTRIHIQHPPASVAIWSSRQRMAQ